MTELKLIETGKAIRDGNQLNGAAQILINADGTRPRLWARFDESLNELVGELVLVNEWEKTLPSHYTIGRNLRKDYADALGMKKGIFLMKAFVAGDCLFNLQLHFIDSSTSEFKVKSFEEIMYDIKRRELCIPKCDTDDQEVFLEESLTGMFKQAIEAVTSRCVKLDFVNRLHYAFTLNKYGVPIDQRNKTEQSVCG